MKIYIENMVCLCCKKIVAQILTEMELVYTCLELGEVRLRKTITTEQITHLKNELHEYGLELMEDKNAILVERIVATINEMIHEPEEVPNVNFSDYLTQHLTNDDHNYHYLSALFSATKGVTIEHFIILNKIERVKELIMYDRLSLTEISYKLRYSSVAHLSNQFKKITGLTPTFFKGLKKKKRLVLKPI
jgi:YesN/AraC family two-component response regulator